MLTLNQTYPSRVPFANLFFDSQYLSLFDQLFTLFADGAKLVKDELTAIQKTVRSFVMVIFACLHNSLESRKE